MIVGTEALRPWWPMAVVADSAGPPVVVAGTRDRERIAAWNLSNGELLHEFAVVDSICANGLTAGRLPDGRLVVVACGDYGIARWDVRTGQPLPYGDRFERDQYWSVAMHGTLLAAAVQDGHSVVRRWNVLTGEPLHQFGPHGGHHGIIQKLTMATSRDGSPVLVSADEGGRIMRREAITGAPIGEPLSSNLGCGSVRLATVPYRSGHVLVAADVTGRICRWDLWSGEPIGQPLQGPADLVCLAGYLPAGHPVILASCDGDLVYRWDAMTGAPVGTPEPGTVLAAGQDAVVISSDEHGCRIESPHNW
jgi:WD40 repeat protein